MTYFTILHWFAIIVIGLLTVLIIALSIRNHDGKGSLPSTYFFYTFYYDYFWLFLLFMDSINTQKLLALKNIVQKKCSLMNLSLFQDKYVILGISK